MLQVQSAPVKAKTVQERKRLVLGNDETIVTHELEPTGKKKSVRPLMAIGIDMGFSIAIPMTVGTLLGVYLDKRLDTAPVLTLTLLFLSVIGSVYSMYRLITKELKKF